MLHTCCKCFITKLNHNFVINKFTFDSTPIISLANIISVTTKSALFISFPVTLKPPK